MRYIYHSLVVRVLGNNIVQSKIKTTGVENMVV